MKLKYSIIITALLTFFFSNNANAQLIPRNPLSTSVFSPHFGITAESYFNANDFLLSFGMGLEETGYDFSASFNVGFRPYLKKIRIQDENIENLYYQYRERVTLFSIDLEKRFFFLDYFSKVDKHHRFGLYAKAKFGFLYVNYRGLSNSGQNRFLIAPGTGLSWEMKNVRISAGYLQFDQGSEVSSNMIDITLNLFFNNKQQ
jgi:hypothetical protein